MRTFKQFLHWYNNYDVVPTLEAMRKMADFYHLKGIDMLNFGCTLPNLAIICLHKSITAKFYPFTENEKDTLEKIREDRVGGPSIVLTWKAVVDEAFNRDSTKLCRGIVGIYASQLLSFFYVSSNSTCSLHEMETRFGILQILTASKQDEDF